MKVAVFGHYDSRGGTAAYPLPDEPTVRDVMAAILKYDQEQFDWMPGQRSPGVDDFMYVADLYGDLTDAGNDLEETGIVAMQMGVGYHVDPDAAEPQSPNHQFFNLDQEIQKSITEPVQLEYIHGRERDAEEDEMLNVEDHDRVLIAYAASKVQYLPSGAVGVPHWNDDAFGFVLEVKR